MRHFFILLFIGFVSCKEQTAYQAIVLSSIEVEEFTSGSGMESYQGYHYAVGDDSPFLVALDHEGKISRKWQIWPDEFVVEGRIMKKEKPDFEAVAIVGDQLFIFGSGSKSPQRDVILWGDIANPDSLQTVYSKKLYDHIREAAQLGERELNLEGATFHKEHLVLLNRATNELYRIKKDEFFAYLATEELTDIYIERHSFDLPLISDQPSTFSGAEMIANSNKLLFTASVEATEDWVGDGDILGSFVGIIDLDQLEEKNPLCVLVKDETGANFIGKIEAASVISVEKDSYTLVAITDDDDGSTVFLTIQLSK